MNNTIQEYMNLYRIIQNDHGRPEREQAELEIKSERIWENLSLKDKDEVNRLIDAEFLCQCPVCISNE